MKDTIKNSLTQMCLNLKKIVDTYEKDIKDIGLLHQNEEVDSDVFSAFLLIADIENSIKRVEEKINEIK